MFDGIWRICLVVALAAVLAMLLGQGCQPPVDSPNFAVVTNCGLSAVECVSLFGAAPIALAAGDFNEDGAADLAAANFGLDNISILLNAGGGQLESAGNRPTGDSPFAVVAGDWNGDGHIDLAATGGFAITLYDGDGRGAFSAGRRMEMSDAPADLLAGDFDGDGDLDLASANGAFNSIWVFLNDGRGRFTAQDKIVVSEIFVQLNGIAAADFNGDGALDLAVSHRFFGHVSVLLNKGDGTFDVPWHIEISGEHSILNAVAAGDLDGDGRADLLVLDNGDAFDEADLGQVVVLLNKGDGAFGPPKRYWAGDSPTAAAIADLDGDGDNDLAVANNVSNDVSILRNDGRANFTLTDSAGVGRGPSFVSVADFNGDEYADLAVANLSSDTISLLHNDGTGSFTTGR